MVGGVTVGWTEWGREKKGMVREGEGREGNRRERKGSGKESVRCRSGNSSLPLGSRSWECFFWCTNLSAMEKAWCWTLGISLYGFEQSYCCSVTVLKWMEWTCQLEEAEMVVSDCGWGLVSDSTEGMAPGWSGWCWVLDFGKPVFRSQLLPLTSWVTWASYQTSPGLIFL